MMFLNKPIWSPNVIVIIAGDNVSHLIDFFQKLAKSIKTETEIIGVYLDHEFVSPANQNVLIAQPDYKIFIEENSYQQHLPSKLLKNGVQKSYYIIPKNNNYRAAYTNFMDIVGNNNPIICITRNVNNEIQAAAIINLSEIPVAENHWDAVTALNKKITFKDKEYSIN